MTSIVAIYETISGPQKNQRLFYVLTGFLAEGVPNEFKDTVGLIWKNMAVNPDTKQWIWDYYYFDKKYQPNLVSGHPMGKRVFLDELQADDCEYIKQLAKNYIWPER